MHAARDAEIAAVAAPVFGHGSRIVGALSVSGPRCRIEALGEAKIVPALFKHAQELMRSFGGNGIAPAFAGWLKPAFLRRSVRRNRRRAPRFDR